MSLDERLSTKKNILFCIGNSLVLILIQGISGNRKVYHLSHLFLQSNTLMLGHVQATLEQIMTLGV